MLFLDRLAEQKIQEAEARGEFDNLPGAGKPLPDEENLAGVEPALRMAYRILKNAGYVPEEVRLRREIAEVRQLLQQSLNDEQLGSQVHRRLLILTERLGYLRGSNLRLEDPYLTQIRERLSSSGAKKDPPEGGSKKRQVQERRFNANRGGELSLLTVMMDAEADRKNCRRNQDCK